MDSITKPYLKLSVRVKKYKKVSVRVSEHRALFWIECPRALYWIEHPWNISITWWILSIQTLLFFFMNIYQKIKICFFQFFLLNIKENWKNGCDRILIQNTYIISKLYMISNLKIQGSLIGCKSCVTLAFYIIYVQLMLLAVCVIIVQIMHENCIVGQWLLLFTFE